MNMTIRDRLIRMINSRKIAQGHALERRDFQAAADFDGQIKGIEAVYEALNGTGVLDFELDRGKEFKE